jgi:predicted Zn finger-like uncharacterized protein
MRVVCPSCDAAYDVPETVLTARPMLRCARCAHDFRPPGRPPEPAEAAVPEEIADETPPAAPDHAFVPAPEAEPDIVPPPAPPSDAPYHADVIPSAKRRQVLAGWAASAVVIVLVLSLGASCRHAVMHAWPPSIRLYAVFGLHPN